MQTNKKLLPAKEKKTKDCFISLDYLTFKALGIRTAVSPVGPI
jgi:hypothetical protein